MGLRSFLVALLTAAWCLVGATGCPKATGPVVLPPAATTTDSEAVRSGDKLTIEVRGQEDLTGDYTVTADGTIRFPRIGDIPAGDRDPNDIARDIETGLADGWLRNPHVTVAVSERQNPEEVTVLGEVKEAGSYAHDGKLTLMKAISLAGGLNPEAQPRRVKLTRVTDAGRKTVEVDVQAIIEGRAADLPVAPGDIIVVPQSAL